MKKTIKTLGLVFALIYAFNGCTRTTPLIDKDIEEAKMEESAYRKAMNNEDKAKRIMDLKIKAEFVKSSVYYAVSQIASSLDVKMDNDFKPASSYKVTMDFEGTFGEFLDVIYNETGIKYKYRNGVLSVFNKNEVERSYTVKPCSKSSKRITIALDGVEPSQVFKYFSQNYNMNFTFHTKFYSLNENANGMPRLGNVSLFYKGCDEMQALRNFVRANDLKVEVASGKNIEVYDYDEAQIDLPTYFDLNFQSGGTGMSGGGSQSSGGTAGGMGSTTTVTTNEKFKEEFQRYVEQYLTPSMGKVYASNRGYLTVMDKPSVVKQIKKLVREEKRRQDSVFLTVNVIRVDLKDTLAMGVDWNVALGNIADRYGYSILTAGYNYADKVEGGLNITGTKNGLTNMVNALQEYGNSKIVRSFSVKTRSGILNTFKAVDEIPYVTTSTIQSSAGVAETTAEAKVAEAGLTINIMPTLADKSESVNLATNIEVSEYQGDKVFIVNGSEYRLPQISTNQLSTPAKVHVGETIVLTGLKLKTVKEGKEGVPGFSQVPSVLGGLFGHNKDTKNTSEFLIVVGIDKARDY